MLGQMCDTQSKERVLIAVSRSWIDLSAFAMRAMRAPVVLVGRCVEVGWWRKQRSRKWRRFQVLDPVLPRLSGGEDG